MRWWEFEPCSQTHPSSLIPSPKPRPLKVNEIHALPNSRRLGLKICIPTPHPFLRRVESPNPPKGLKRADLRTFAPLQNPWLCLSTHTDSNSSSAFHLRSNLREGMTFSSENNSCSDKIVFLIKFVEKGSQCSLPLSSLILTPQYRLQITLHTHTLPWRS